LEWTHLFVPLVPTAYASDLVQYPAPYMLGIPSDEGGSLELVQGLPDDVTLVDVDVGRVILAKTFSHDFEKNSRSGGVVGGETAKYTAAKLRAQVLYLAEGLGGVLGGMVCERVWRCDSPSLGMDTFGGGVSGEERETKGQVLQSMAHEFIQELLAGSITCCFWMEEEMGIKPSLSSFSLQGTNDGDRDVNILFDEDRFFHLKTLRADGCYLPLLLGERYFTSAATVNDTRSPQNRTEEDAPLSSDQLTTPQWRGDKSGEDDYNRLERTAQLDSKSDFALDPAEFGLILETFLRGQGVSSWISSQRKGDMVFW